MGTRHVHEGARSGSRIVQAQAVGSRLVGMEMSADLGSSVQLLAGIVFENVRIGADGGQSSRCRKRCRRWAA